MSDVLRSVAGLANELEIQGVADRVSIDDLLLALSEARLTLREDRNDECGHELAGRLRTQLAEKKQMRLAV